MPFKFNADGSIATADINGQMIKNDFAWAARERNAILTQWTASFDGKSEAKQ